MREVMGIRGTMSQIHCIAAIHKAMNYLFHSTMPLVNSACWLFHHTCASITSSNSHAPWINMSCPSRLYSPASRVFNRRRVIHVNQYHLHSPWPAFLIYSVILVYVFAHSSDDEIILIFMKNSNYSHFVTSLLGFMESAFVSFFLKIACFL